MSEMLSFPAGNARIEKAIDANGEIIGVSIIMLVLPKDFGKLPGMFHEAARLTYSEVRPNLLS